MSNVHGAAPLTASKNLRTRGPRITETTPANAFANVFVTDANGRNHSLGGIPLYAGKDRVNDGLLAKVSEEHIAAAIAYSESQAAGGDVPAPELIEVTAVIQIRPNLPVSDTPINF